MKMEKAENNFNEYCISSEISEALTLLGYDRPTKVQQQVIPLILAGKNVVVKSQTGTGKTAAFSIPVCEKIRWEENLPQALILEPTRELAEQVKNEVFYIGRKKRIKVPALFGGFPIDKQIQTLRQKSHIVVGTPGRIMDHLRRESLKLQEIKYLIIDEADLMLDMGFFEEVEQILKQVPKGSQILLFSATLGEKLQQLTSKYMECPVSVIQEGETETAPEIEQTVYETEPEEKYKVFKQILIQENPECCMIFCGTREMVNVLFQKLRRDRIFCGMIHGEIEQKERLKTVDAFRRGGFRFLIATDVAARGIDFEEITHVMNYDFPTGKETYVHRVGRTGRNGNAGKAISIICEQDKRMLQMVEHYISMTLPTHVCPETLPEQEKAFWARQREKKVSKTGKGDALNREIMRLSIGGGKKSKMRAVDIVGTICNIEGIESDDIGIIDVRESLTYVEILNGKGKYVLEVLQEKPIKGKRRKVRKA